jgi:RNA polymerase sigma-70 factor (ECF subfamily)
MFWSLKSTRATDAAHHTLEAVLRRFFLPGSRSGGPRIGLEIGSETGLEIGFGGLEAVSLAGLAGRGINPGFRSPGLTSFQAKSMRPGAGVNRPMNESSGEGNSGPETVHGAQPSPRDGVPEDMATMVLDNPALGAGSALGTNPVTNPADAGLGLRGDVDPASDAAVMLRVAAGDEAGFNFLVGKYHRPMIHFLYRMVHNQAVAEELAQEVFLRVYRARDSYRAEARFTTWLYRIATNLAVNHARDTRHERAAQTVYLDAPDEETGTTPDLADDEPTVEQRLLRDERMAAIRSHVMALPERQRMAVLMHKYQGMDYRQIGEVLKLSESATKSLLFRAYQTLRDKLKDFV